MDTNLGQVVLVKDINPGVFEGYNGPVRPIDFFRPGEAESNEELDSSADESTRISVPSPSSPDSSFPSSLVEFNDKLYFSADDGENGNELFVSDGTAEGTQLVADLRPGEGNYGYIYGFAPNNLVEFNDKLYFAANDGESGNELFVSDGTAEGTQLVVDVRPGEDNYGYIYGSTPNNLVEFNDKLYFTANDGKSGNELFVTDGTAEGTQLVVDLAPGENNYGYSYGSFPSNLVEFNDKLYFTANDGESGYELFVSDGTAEGTQLLVDLYPEEDNYGYSYGSFPNNLVEFNDKLYFTADDAENGYELFVSDGTAEGTQLLVDLYPGENNYGFSNGSFPSNFVEFNDKLYFSANDGESGNELFVSDGTAEGTQLLVDLYPGENNYGFTNSSYPSSLVEFDDKLYFTANDGENGNELFVTDGTVEGTQLVADIRPGTNPYGYSYGSAPYELTVVGDELFFSANNGETGTELFKLTLDDSVGETPALINGSDASDNLLGGDRSEQIQALSGQDTVDSRGGNDTVDGGDGDDLLTGGAGNDSLIGGNGNDTLNSGNGDDVLLSGNGSDVLNSGNGNDRLTGGGDNDLLDGGVGNDTLDGGNGDDVFVLSSDAGSETIVDFNLGGKLNIGGDQLGLANGLQFDDLSFAGQTILVGEQVLVTLDGINTEELTSGDFKTI
jgi:ELWxxDGT repeat protein